MMEVERVGKLFEGFDAKAFQSYWPFFVGIGIAILLTGLAISFDLFIMGFAIMAYGLYGWLSMHKNLTPLEGPFVTEDPKDHILGGISTRKLGMWIFLGSETLFFAGLIGTSLAIRSRAGDWPEPGEILNVPLTAANTFILICSSVTIVEALKSIQMGNQKRFRFFISATLALGALFVIVQGYEYWALWHHENLTPSVSTYGTTFYTQTGFHGAHVSAGLVALAFVTAKAFKGGYTTESHEEVELMGLYWHFVDVVWIFLFTIVYLI
jgi:heme/copper-type cytochrome/quinol oxidase subunit 3